MGVNVLALAPRRCVMLTGNPRTRRALEQAGASVIEYDGSEISAKGCGGPTCLTRPLVREPAREIQSSEFRIQKLNCSRGPSDRNSTAEGSREPSASVQFLNSEF